MDDDAAIINKWLTLRGLECKGDNHVRPTSDGRASTAQCRKGDNCFKSPAPNFPLRRQDGPQRFPPPPVGPLHPPMTECMLVAAARHGEARWARNRAAI